MVLTLRSDRALAYQPYLPLPEFWDECMSAGLQIKAKAQAHDAKMAARAAAAATDDGAAAKSSGRHRKGRRKRWRGVSGGGVGVGVEGELVGPSSSFVFKKTARKSWIPS